MAQTAFRLSAVAALAVATVAAAPAFAQTRPAGPPACAPVVRDAWIRLPPGAMPMAAGYARIENPCGRERAVTMARSAAFGDVSLHETRVEDGVSRMREVPRLAIGANASVAMRPGGLHLMLMQPVAPLAAGQRLPIEFVLDDGTVVRADFDVRAAAAR